MYIYMYMYTCTHIHMHMYVYMCICIHMCYRKKHVDTTSAKHRENSLYCIFSTIYLQPSQGNYILQKIDCPDRITRIRNGDNRYQSFQHETRIIHKRLPLSLNLDFFPFLSVFSFMSYTSTHPHTHACTPYATIRQFVHSLIFTCFCDLVVITSVS